MQIILWVIECPFHTERIAGLLSRQESGCFYRLQSFYP